MNIIVNFTNGVSVVAPPNTTAEEFLSKHGYPDKVGIDSVVLELEDNTSSTFVPE